MTILHPLGLQMY